MILADRLAQKFPAVGRWQFIFVEISGNLREFGRDGRELRAIWGGQHYRIRRPDIWVKDPQQEGNREAPRP